MLESKSARSSEIMSERVHSVFSSAYYFSCLLSFAILFSSSDFSLLIADATDDSILSEEVNKLTLREEAN